MSGKQFRLVHQVCRREIITVCTLVAYHLHTSGTWMTAHSIETLQIAPLRLFSSSCPTVYLEKQERIDFFHTVEPGVAIFQIYGSIPTERTLVPTHPSEATDTLRCLQLSVEQRLQYPLITHTTNVVQPMIPVYHQQGSLAGQEGA